MILPNDDEIKERGVKLCIMAVHEFFMLAFPEIAAEKGIKLDIETQMTFYSLANSDEDYVQLMANQWGINLDAQALSLPSLEDLEKGALEYVNQFKQREQGGAPTAG